MDSLFPTTQRTQGDGMEKVENENLLEQTIVLQPKELKEAINSDAETEMIPSNKGILKDVRFPIKLPPQTINKKKKDILSSLKNKEPKFVPYEPYKAAVRPIIPLTKKSAVHQKVRKKPKDFTGIFHTQKNQSNSEKKEKQNHENEQDIKVSELDLHTKLKALESELQTIKEENEQLENQLKFQVQVNGELKNLLVAAVGEDMETKVHVLTEDKLHLAQALLRSAESLTTHQEQTEWLAGQCEVWRSKFLASSVMVEELARWKASLSQKVNEAHDVLKKFLEEKQKIYDYIIKTHKNLCLLRNNFDLHGKKNNPTSCNIIDACVENFKLSEVLLLELLGSDKSSLPVQSFSLDYSKKTVAEKAAEHVLSNPNILQLIGEPDAACNAVVGAAVTLSSQLYLRSHPPKIGCCPQCSGEMKLV